MKYFVCILFFAVNAFGQLEGNPENWCRNGVFPRENVEFKLAKIIGKKNEKVYFYGDDADCPKNGDCRLKSYVVPKDEMIVSRTFGSFACSWFQPKKGAETVGWIEVNKLEEIATNSAPELDDWFGEWSYYENSITIGKGEKSGELAIKGDAFWKGLGDNVHIGELDHSAKPLRNVLKLGETEEGEFACKVTMRLVGKFLIVSDNLNCGGVNVSFSGVYLKK